MTYDPERHHRRSIRLQGYDYAQVGAYFVTICTQDRACLFGDVADGQMVLNDAGQMVEKWWLEMNRKFSTMETDEYIIMPNHFHGIVVIVGADHVGADLCVCPVDSAAMHAGAHTTNSGAHTTNSGAHTTNSGAHTTNSGAHTTNSGAHTTNSGAHTGAPLPDIIQWFKTMTTNEYIRGVKTSGWPPFHGKLWQRNYYEHIIRNDESLNRIRQYIANNPAQWEMDRENPNVAGVVRKPHLQEDEPWRI